jgi:hypothetical protein
METVVAYCENNIGHTDALCGQKAELQHVKAGGLKELPAIKGLMMYEYSHGKPKSLYRNVS